MKKIRGENCAQYKIELLKFSPPAFILPFSPHPVRPLDLHSNFNNFVFFLPQRLFKEFNQVPKTNKKEKFQYEILGQWMRVRVSWFFSP